MFDLEKDDKKCVDISTWSELKFKKVEKEHCKVEYEKITEKKQDKVQLSFFAYISLLDKPLKKVTFRGKSYVPLKSFQPIEHLTLQKVINKIL